MKRLSTQRFVAPDNRAIFAGCNYNPQVTHRLTMDDTSRMQGELIIVVLLFDLFGRCLKVWEVELGTQIHFFCGKRRGYKDVGLLEREESPLLFFSYSFCSGAWNICQHSDWGGREHTEGLAEQQAQPRTRGEPCSLEWLPCLFALTLCSLWGYRTCSVNGAIVLQEKSVTNIYHEGNAKPWLMASQTWAIKFTTVHF